jgi:hypothetical protein
MADEMGDLSALRVCRIGFERLGVIRTFSLFVDGSPSGDIGLGDCVDSALRPGRHSVDVRMDSVKSNTLVLNLTLGTVTELTVELIEDVSTSFFRWVLSAVTQSIFGYTSVSTKLRLVEGTDRE